ncbi:hypothetical protein O9G_006161, partial [Rozella allomycis CSF55]
MSSFKPTKLKFKGDKPKTQKRKREKKPEATDTKQEYFSEDESELPLWMPIKSTKDVFGPLYITLRAENLMCITFSEEGQLELKEAAEEPTEVNQVVSAQKNHNESFSFKTGF